MSRTHSLWPLGLLAALTVALIACPKKPEPLPPPIIEEDAGSDASVEDGGVDGGEADAGFRCIKDDDCERFDQGLRCEDKTGECIPARGCNDDTNCDSVDEEDYCYHYGLQCRCVTETNPEGYPGVCRRRRAVCEECTDSSQCGQSGVFDPVGACRSMAGDSSGKKYCLQAQVGSSCGCGMINDGQGYCKPQSNDCSQVGCTEDKNCPGGSVCNKNACLCEPRCRWDFQLKAEAAPGCPPGRVCWVDNVNLDPSSLFYGAGRCRPACNGNTDCTDTVANPFGGPKLKCAAEQLQGGGLSPKRCRANGACMDNLECPELPADSIYVGYCDRSTFACKTDCRLGIDPVTGQSFRDCRSGYKCEAGPAGANICVLKTCLEMGGARLACARGQYCCGEDKNSDGVPDPCPPANLREINGCYTAPKPPFCTVCEGPDDCKNFTPPSWLAGACSNGSKSPTCSPLPNLCVNAGKRPDGSDGVAICAPSTWNDTTKDSFGVGKDVRGCPATYAAVSFKPKFTGQDDPNYCTTNADCQVGNDGGFCEPDLSERLEDGGHPLACKCTTPGQVGQCPNTTDGGITSVCKAGIASPTICIQSVVCIPSSGVAYKDAGAPDFGCGL